MPADPFYKWRTQQDRKQPFAIARRDGQPIAFAGLWEGWRSPDGKAFRSYTILTTAANPVMARLHERMPVILEPADWPLWLGEAEGDPLSLLRAAPDDTLRVWPVGRPVNSVRNNRPELLIPIDLGEPALAE